MCSRWISFLNSEIVPFTKTKWWHTHPHPIQLALLLTCCPSCNNVYISLHMLWGGFVFWIIISKAHLPVWCLQLRENDLAAWDGKVCESGWWVNPLLCLGDHLCSLPYPRICSCYWHGSGMQQHFRTRCCLWPSTTPLLSPLITVRTQPEAQAHLTSSVSMPPPTLVKKSLHCLEPVLGKPLSLSNSLLLYIFSSGSMPRLGFSQGWVLEEIYFY